MEFIERAKIMIEHWITHNNHHSEEYESFAKQLDETGKIDSANHVREMIELTSKCNECLRKALKTL